MEIKKNKNKNKQTKPKIIALNTTANWFFPFLLGSGFIQHYFIKEIVFLLLHNFA